MMISEKLSSFRDIAINILQEFDYAIEQLSLADREQEKLLHDIENASSDDAEKLGRKLRNCRIKRREYKDTISLLSPFRELLKKNDKLINDLNTIIGRMREQEKIISKDRIYGYKNLEVLIKEYKKQYKERRR